MSKTEFPFHTKPCKWIDSEGIPEESGLLAIFINSYDNLSDEWVDSLKRDDHLLYIGEANLKQRLTQHFHKSDFENDTFRKSIGAILYECLGLRLPNEDELSTWIQDNCRYTYLENGRGKGKYIYSLRPPINIAGNPDKIQKLSEARKNAYG